MPIFNALTNWLAIGDITLIKGDGGVKIIEVKKSDTGSSRVTRQKQKMREVAELLKHGEGQLEGQQVRIVRFDIFPENGLDRLKALFDAAGHKGWAAERISKFLYIECVDFRAIEDFDAFREEVGGVRGKELGPSVDRNDVVFDESSMDILAFTPNCAPFSVFPFPARTCVEIMTGAKAYVSFLNLTEVGREFERNGWEVEKWPQDLMVEGADRNTPIFVLRSDGFHPQIPPADLMRMQMEMLRPQVLIKTLDKMFEKGPAGTPLNSFSVYEREGEIWN